MMCGIVGYMLFSGALEHYACSANLLPYVLLFYCSGIFSPHACNIYALDHEVSLKIHKFDRVPVYM